MSSPADTVTPTGAVARKGTKGFLKSSDPQRSNRVQAYLSDKEMKILQSYYISRNCSASKLLRDLINALPVV